MSTLNRYLSVVPRRARVLAVLLALSTAVLVFILSIQPPKPTETPLPVAAKVLLPIFASVFPLVLVLLYGFIYGDAKRRGMRYVMWTFLAIFLPYAIGFILYFILRDPLPVACRSCSATVSSKLAFCPRCGASLKPTCPRCGQTVETIWSHCGHCGSQLPGPTPPAA